MRYAHPQTLLVSFASMVSSLGIDIKDFIIQFHKARHPASRERIYIFIGFIWTYIILMPGK